MLKPDSDPGSESSGAARTPCGPDIPLRTGVRGGHRGEESAVTDNDGGDGDEISMKLLISMFALITALVTYASSHR